MNTPELDGALSNGAFEVMGSAQILTLPNCLTGPQEIKDVTQKKIIYNTGKFSFYMWDDTLQKPQLIIVSK